MEPVAQWKRFWETGAVGDYLAYRAAAAEREATNLAGEHEGHRDPIENERR